MKALGWRRLVGALGAQVDAVDARAIDRAQLRSALLEHQLIVFRNQSLSPREFVQFASLLGRLEHYPFADPLPESEHVVAIVKEAHDTHNFGGAWHSDTSYLPKPPSATLLYAVEVPDGGGDTLFADMYRAYDSLSHGMQECLSRLHGHNTASLVHDAAGAYADVAAGRVPSAKSAESTSADHPVVCLHPDTGRAALYLSLIHTERFVGMTRAESLPLLSQLQEHAIAADNCSRLRWAPGTLAIWDNRCVQHYPLNDYPGKRREMWRIIVAGEAPAGRAPTSRAGLSSTVQN